MYLTVRTEALTDGVSAREWYSDASPALGERFARSLDVALDLVLASPGVGAPLRGGYRRLRIRGFPYVLIYTLSESEVVVVAIAHTSRQPGYWARRR